MSEFKFDSESLANSKNIADAIHGNFYPNGNIIVKRTSLYEYGGFADRQLTSYDHQDILQARGLLRPERIVTRAAADATESSLSQALSSTAVAGYGSGDSFEIQNPENQGNTTETKTNSKATIKGSAAIQYTLAETLISRNLFGNVGRGIINTLQEAYLMNQTDPNLSADEEPLDVDIPSAGRMDVTVSSELTEEEKQWYLDRGATLRNITVTAAGESSGESPTTGSVVSDHSFLNGTGILDIEDSLTDISETGTYYPGVTEDGKVSADIITRGPVEIFPSAALIELIIKLNSSESSIRVKGGLGMHRADEPDKQGPNLTPLESGDGISDHVFGRGFDVSHVGLKSDAILASVEMAQSNPTEYQKLLELLLEELNTIAATQLYLIPDSIVFHGQLGSTYGLVSGKEPETSEIIKKYPNLKYVNFSADANHNDHIHMSFSGARAGKYAGPNGELTLPVVYTGGEGGSAYIGTSTTLINTISRFLNTGTQDSSGLSGLAGAATYVKLTRPYTSEAQVLSMEEFAAGMNQYWGIEACAVFWGICRRESNHKPWNLNAGWNGSDVRYSGDYSFGITQYNALIGSHGNKTFVLPFSATGRDVSQPVTIWKLAFKDWATTIGLDAKPLSEANFNNFIKEFSKNKLMADSIQYASPDLFIPANQFLMSVYNSGIYEVPGPGEDLLMRRLTDAERAAGARYDFRFGAWGDYKQGSKGFISSVSYADVKEFYTKMTGNSEEDFKSWFRLVMYDNSLWTQYQSPAYKYIEEWMSGAEQKNWTGNVTPIVPTSSDISGGGSTIPSTVPGTPTSGSNNLPDYPMPNEVVLIGDSISHVVANELVTELQESGFDEPLILTGSGKTIATPLPMLGTFTSTGFETLQELKNFYNYIYQGSPKAKTWIIELGGNDMLQKRNAASVVQDVNKLLDFLKEFLTDDAIVYWVIIGFKQPNANLNSFVPWLKAIVRNAMKERLPNSNDNNRKIIEWLPLVALNPGYLINDGIHLSQSGKTAYVQLIKSSLEQPYTPIPPGVPDADQLS